MLQRRQRIVLILFFSGIAAFILALAACGTILPAPAPTSTPTCLLVPQATGERIIPPRFETPAPASARPGETLRLHFSGGYVAFHYEEICNGNPAGFIYGDDLPTPQRSRNYTATLDNRPLAIHSECNGKCTLEIDIPANITPGNYTLVLMSPLQVNTNIPLRVVEE
ncbi:MAG: hypothetical protein EHM21_17305 [Chloroflexi bacterium]|nr:MAG: hypothetical protein EHM21_17305 [Chloroflexota bacterium]